MRPQANGSLPLALSLLLVQFVASCLVQKNPPPQDQGGGAQPDAGDPSMQCVNGSAECFALCGSPECALRDNTIPPVLDTPVIWYQPGGSVNGYGDPAPAVSTADPCVAINDASKTIRQRSCAPCHGPPPAAGYNGFNYVLDDVTLAGHKDHSGSKVMVAPGDPLSSYVYERVVTGLAGPGSMGMPPDPTQYAVSFVSPSAADVTVLYAWILNCTPTGSGGVASDGGAYQANYGSGSFGSNPSPGAGQ